jgi:hypothetical protein
MERPRRRGRSFSLRIVSVARDHRHTIVVRDRRGAARA